LATESTAQAEKRAVERGFRVDNARDLAIAMDDWQELGRSLGDTLAGPAFRVRFGRLPRAIATIDPAHGPIDDRSKEANITSQEVNHGNCAGSASVASGRTL